MERGPFVRTYIKALFDDYLADDDPKHFLSLVQKYPDVFNNEFLLVNVTEHDPKNVVRCLLDNKDKFVEFKVHWNVINRYYILGYFECVKLLIGHRYGNRNQCGFEWKSKNMQYYEKQFQKAIFTLLLVFNRRPELCSKDMQRYIVQKCIEIYRDTGWEESSQAMEPIRKKRKKFT